MKLEKILARIIIFFLTGGLFVALTSPVILVFIVMHFLIKWW